MIRSAVSVRTGLFSSTDLEEGTRSVLWCDATPPAVSHDRCTPTRLLIALSANFDFEALQAIQLLPQLNGLGSESAYCRDRVIPT